MEHKKDCPQSAIPYQSATCRCLLKIDWKDQYPLNTLTGETRKEFEVFIQSAIDEAVKEREREISEAVEKKKEKLIGGDSFVVEIRLIRNSTLSEVLSIINPE